MNNLLSPTSTPGRNFKNTISVLDEYRVEYGMSEVSEVRYVPQRTLLTLWCINECTVEHPSDIFILKIKGLLFLFNLNFFDNKAIFAKKVQNSFNVTYTPLIGYYYYFT